jgi:hypothetical protein
MASGLKRTDFFTVEGTGFALSFAGWVMMESSSGRRMKKHGTGEGGSSKEEREE